jgi:8-oxo-dGTP diphosphatase
MSIDRVAVSVDVACFALRDGVLALLLVQRQAEPFAGSWALPGGVVQGREALDAAAGRILAERTGLTVAYLEQLYTFGDPDRDPRGRTLSVAYYALLPLAAEVAPQPGRGVEALRWAPVDDLPPLAFDHARIAAYARQRLAQKVAYAPLAFLLLPEQFTMADLRHVHEAIEGRPYTHLSNFQTLMRARWDLLRVPGALDRRTKRPAQLYRYAGPLAISGPPEEADGDDDLNHEETKEDEENEERGTKNDGRDD